jgi:hypothetical protein
MKSARILSLAIVGLIGMGAVVGNAKEAESKECKDKEVKGRQKAGHGWGKVIKYLREKYPNEVKEIRELREKGEKDAARDKFKALMKKARGENPEFFKQSKKVKGKKGGARPNVGFYMMMKYPDQLKEIGQLRKKDRKAATEKYKALMEKAREEMKQEREKFIKLVKEYQKTKDAKLLAEIKDKVTQAYSKRLDFQKKMIDNTQERLNDMKKRLEKDLAKKDEMIENKVKRIVKDPKLNW